MGANTLQYSRIEANVYCLATVVNLPVVPSEKHFYQLFFVGEKALYLDGVARVFIEQVQPFTV